MTPLTDGGDFLFVRPALVTAIRQALVISGRRWVLPGTAPCDRFSIWILFAVMVRVIGGRLVLVLVWAATVAALVVAVVMAGQVRFAVMGKWAEVMLGVLVVIGVLGQLPWGPTAAGSYPARLVRALVVCVVAVDGLVFASQLRDDPPTSSPEAAPRVGDATVLVVVWTVFLALFVLAALRVTAQRAEVPPRVLVGAAVCGFGAATVWLAFTVLAPSLASTILPAALAIVCAGTAAVFVGVRMARREHPDGGDRTAPAALLAATITALVVAVTIDGLLPLWHAWARNNAPPWAGGARLMDPVGLFMLGALLALLTAVVARRPRPDPVAPPTAASVPAT